MCIHLGIGKRVSRRSSSRSKWKKNTDGMDTTPSPEKFQSGRRNVALNPDNHSKDVLLESPGQGNTVRQPLIIFDGLDVRVHLLESSNQCSSRNFRVSFCSLRGWWRQRRLLDLLKKRTVWPFQEKSGKQSWGGGVLGGSKLEDFGVYTILAWEIVLAAKAAESKNLYPMRRRF